MQSSDYLVWIDLEMTGLKPDTDVIIEMATIVTDPRPQRVAEGPVIAIHQPDGSPGGHGRMEQAHARRFGPIDRVRAARTPWRAPKNARWNPSTRWSSRTPRPMCGNSICQDRRFLARHMPTLEKFFHYRNLDVSTLKELARRWAPEILAGLLQAGRAQGAGRHPGIDPRARVLPPALSRAAHYQSS